MRLAKYMADAGIASRRKSEEIIRQGRIRLNGKIVKEPGVNIDSEKDVIELDGKKLESEKKVYILLNKPDGYISSVSDTHGRKTVLDLIKEKGKRIYPVGRLDFDTEGLILLSNDGDFTNMMIHPRYGIKKKYEALVRGKIQSAKIKQLENGVLLDDGKTAPARVRLISCRNNKSLLHIEIHEGRKRQVKRMCEAVGHPVEKLKRIEYGCLNLKGVDRGKYRYLKQAEVKKLMQMARGSEGAKK